jgi:hypothetical protein
MMVKGSRIEHDKAIVRPNPAMTGENCRVRPVQNYRAPRVRNGPREQGFSPNVIGNDHVIGKSCGHSLDNQQRFEQDSMLADVEFAGVELWDNVMYIENDFATHQFGNQRRKHLKVRNGMNMN